MQVSNALRPVVVYYPDREFDKWLDAIQSSSPERFNQLTGLLNDVWYVLKEKKGILHSIPDSYTSCILYESPEGYPKELTPVQHGLHTDVSISSEGTLAELVRVHYHAARKTVIAASKLYRSDINQQIGEYNPIEINV
jgi:hypothetical protein